MNDGRERITEKPHRRFNPLSGDDRVSLFSGEYPEPIGIELNTLRPEPAERNTPEAFIRGVAAARQRQGKATRGFTAVVDSTCKPGTGLSSSAAFAVLIGGIFSVLENEAPEPLLLDVLEGKPLEQNKTITLPTRLVVRGST